MKSWLKPATLNPGSLLAADIAALLYRLLHGAPGADGLLRRSRAPRPPNMPKKARPLMTIPLIILAVLVRHRRRAQPAWLSIPLTNWLEHTISTVAVPARGRSFNLVGGWRSPPLLALVAIALGLVCSMAGAIRSCRSCRLPGAQMIPCAVCSDRSLRLLENKYWVDELYQAGYPRSVYHGCPVSWQMWSTGASGMTGSTIR